MNAEGNAPTDSDLDEAAEWWRRTAPPDARDLIDAVLKPAEVMLKGEK